jgi:hypothetical protein
MYNKDDLVMPYQQIDDNSKVRNENNISAWFLKVKDTKGIITNINTRAFYKYAVKFENGQVNFFHENELRFYNINRRVI